MANPDAAACAGGVNLACGVGREAAAGRAAAVDREAVAGSFVRALFDDNAADLLRYVRRMTPGDPGRAEDLVQETFLRAWRHRAGLVDHGGARAWLFRVARNLAVDGFRRQAARPGERELPAGVEAALADPRAADALDAVLLRGVLVEALRSMPARQREALIHLHCLDRTQTETAALLGVPLGTVKSRHHLAVRELRRALGSRGIHGR